MNHRVNGTFPPLTSSRAVHHPQHSRRLAARSALFGSPEAAWVPRAKIIDSTVTHSLLAGLGCSSRADRSVPVRSSASGVRSGGLGSAVHSECCSQVSDGRWLP